MQRARILLNINKVCIIRLTLFPSCVLIFDHIIGINKMAANFTMLAAVRLYGHSMALTFRVHYSFLVDFVKNEIVGFDENLAVVL